MRMVQVDHHAAVAGGLARAAVSAALHGEQHLVRAREVDRRLHVRGVLGLRDQRRVAVERGIHDRARRVVALVSGHEQRAPELAGELADVGALERDGAAVAGDRREVPDGLVRSHHRVRNGRQQ
jgi:hypothetical protein